MPNREEEDDMKEQIYPARCVEGADAAIFTAPGKDVEANTQVPGLKPTHLKGPEAESFLRNEIHKRIFDQKERLVLLGNDNGDVAWILDTLKIQSSDRNEFNQS